MTKRKELHLIGCAAGIAGADVESGNGPLVLQSSPLLTALKQQGVQYQWDAMIQAIPNHTHPPIEDEVGQLCVALAETVFNAIKEKQWISVIGGDHSCAIGTWSGVAHAYKEQGDIGLIWIDAHMDAHTPETSLSGRIHGMPVACLLGHGYNSLTTILDVAPKIKPQNLCLIGVRSFESGEKALLEKLNVRIYYMDEVTERGFETVLNEAIGLVNQHTIGYGLTLDIDSIDPLEAPGVDVPEKNGIHVVDVLNGFSNMVNDARLLATEIVEFDPSRDKNQMTEKLVVSLVKILATGRD